jgi:hypothetical protein
MREVRPGHWQRVRIEFEYESRNYRIHGHRGDGCDLIVCWRYVSIFTTETRKKTRPIPRICADERRIGLPLMNTDQTDCTDSRCKNLSTAWRNRRLLSR